MSDLIQYDRGIAIRTALGALLNPEQTVRAVELWHKKYAPQPIFSIQYFVRECCTLLGVESQRNQMVQSLVLELNSQRMGARTEKYTGEKSAKVSGGSSLQNDAAIQTFQLLFRAVVDSAGPLRGREISHYVAGGLAKMSLANDTRRSLELWLSRDMPVIEAVVPVSALIMLVNRAYVGLCEYCGPVKADQMLHECVEAVAKTSSGKQYHPQQLL